MRIRIKFKRFIQKIFGDFSHLSKGVHLKHKWYGNSYGGFYLFPDILSKDSIVYSFGIGEDISFDKAVISRHQCNVYGFDPTPKSIAWIKNQILPETFHFSEYGIGTKNEMVSFYLPKNKEHVSGSTVIQKNVEEENNLEVELKSLKSIMDIFGHYHIDVLKIDIEGSEYDVIENILQEKIPVTQILIEFHDRFFNTKHPRSKPIVEKLKMNGYEIFGISDTYEEISFVKKNALYPN